MNLEFVPYSEELLDTVEELYLSVPPYAAEDICALCEECPERSLVALRRGEAVGIAARTGCDCGRSSFSLFVLPKYRRSHIGTRLTERMLDSMRAQGVSAAYTDYAGEGCGIPEFLNSQGFIHRYDSHFMRYRGDIPDMDADMLPYTDDLFDGVSALLADSFEPIRRELGIAPHRIRADAARREYMREHANSIYVYMENGEIIGTGCAELGEIDSVAVRADKRGLGIGRRLVGHGAALLDSHSQRPTLWVVEGNPARELYERMGFYTDRLHHFYIKEL